MKVKVMRPSRWEHPGEFPMFAKETPIDVANDEDTDFLGWYACNIEGYETFVPKVFVTDGKLARDYNPTELMSGFAAFWVRPKVRLQPLAYGLALVGQPFTSPEPFVYDMPFVR